MTQLLQPPGGCRVATARIHHQLGRNALGLAAVLTEADALNGVAAVVGNQLGDLAAIAAFDAIARHQSLAQRCLQQPAAAGVAA